jgi:hypothetical protein
MTSEVMLELPDHIQGMENILAYITAQFSKGKPQSEVFDRIGKYTKAYFSLLNNPDVSIQMASPCSWCNLTHPSVLFTPHRRPLHPRRWLPLVQSAPLFTAHFTTSNAAG